MNDGVDLRYYVRCMDLLRQMKGAFNSVTKAERYEVIDMLIQEFDDREVEMDPEVEAAILDLVERVEKLEECMFQPGGVTGDKDEPLHTG